VISGLYYRRKTQAQGDGRWLVPKKMHRLAYWAGSLKMRLGPGRAGYLVTVRYPLPSCISVYEKSGGLPPDGLFPAAQHHRALGVSRSRAAGVSAGADPRDGLVSTPCA
ncbi:MAG TPA: hypothetical protein VF265_02265, partial [Nevskiaceae bacterium]